MELESQARLANAALLTKWGYGNHNDIVLAV